MMFIARKMVMSDEYIIVPTTDKLINPYTYQLMCNVLGVNARQLVETLIHSGATVKMNRIPNHKPTISIKFEHRVACEAFVNTLNATVGEINGKRAS